eukprot:TRINITY_DN1479_c0_g1_i1.p1 TRINITY_DN1479_c0_g1~~TRINITY_DN1479_c0_g1_i1.p1  ORF type:complete len:1333 (-),score=294.94 TRINITY_DN1479_c0_g1_i1:163-4161(-)
MTKVVPFNNERRDSKFFPFKVPSLFMAQEVRTEPETLSKPLQVKRKLFFGFWCFVATVIAVNWERSDEVVIISSIILFANILMIGIGFLIEKSIFQISAMSLSVFLVMVINYYVYVIGYNDEPDKESFFLILSSKALFLSGCYILIVNSTPWRYRLLLWVFSVIPFLFGSISVLGIRFKHFATHLDFVSLVVLFSLAILATESKARFISQRGRNENKLLAKENHTIREFTVKENHRNRVFMSFIFHEIRVPFNAISGGIESMLADKNRDPEEFELLGVLKSQSDLMHQILDDVLTVGKLEEKRLTLKNKPFTLKRAIEGACHAIAPEAQRVGMTLTYSVSSKLPHRVLGDRMRFSQVLGNLLSNALKFSKKRVHLSCNCDPLNDNSEHVNLQVRVIDDGAGIEPNNIQSLFNAYYQVNTGLGGTGLGLHICRHLVVDLQAGAVGVESRQDTGSVFYFELVFPIVQRDKPEIDSEDPKKTINLQSLFGSGSHSKVYGRSHSSSISSSSQQSQQSTNMAAIPGSVNGYVDNTSNRNVISKSKNDKNKRGSPLKSILSAGVSFGTVQSVTNMSTNSEFMPNEVELSDGIENNTKCMRNHQSPSHNIALAATLDDASGTLTWKPKRIFYKKKDDWYGLRICSPFCSWLTGNGDTSTGNGSGTDKLSSFMESQKRLQKDDSQRSFHFPRGPRRHALSFGHGGSEVLNQDIKRQSGFSECSSDSPFLLNGQAIEILHLKDEISTLELIPRPQGSRSTIAQSSESDSEIIMRKPQISPRSRRNGSFGTQHISRIPSKLSQCENYSRSSTSPSGGQDQTANTDSATDLSRTQSERGILFIPPVPDLNKSISFNQKRHDQSLKQMMGSIDKDSKNMFGNFHDVTDETSLSTTSDNRPGTPQNTNPIIEAHTPTHIPLHRVNTLSTANSTMPGVSVISNSSEPTMGSFVTFYNDSRSNISGAAPLRSSLSLHGVSTMTENSIPRMAMNLGDAPGGIARLVRENSRRKPIPVKAQTSTRTVLDEESKSSASQQTTKPIGQLPPLTLTQNSSQQQPLQPPPQSSPHIGYSANVDDEVNSMTLPSPSRNSVSPSGKKHFSFRKFASNSGSSSSDMRDLKTHNQSVENISTPLEQEKNTLSIRKTPEVINKKSIENSLATAMKMSENSGSPLADLVKSSEERKLSPVVSCRRTSPLTPYRSVKNSEVNLEPLKPLDPNVKKVLIVEDSNANRLIMARLLRQLGHIPFVSEDGVLALERYDAGERFDLILMDFTMPRMGGIEATRILREKGCRTKVVAVTGNSIGEYQQEFLDVGGDAVLLKPININQFRKLLFSPDTFEPHQPLIL